MKVTLSVLIAALMASNVWAIDFNGDGLLDSADMNLLTRAAVHGAPAGDTFDLNADGRVNRDDVTVWLREAGAINQGSPYHYGDGDLSGSVDAHDFFAWNANKISVNSEWTAGNYFVDHVIDHFDLGVWARNSFGSGYVPPAELPVGQFPAVRAFYDERFGQLMIRSEIPLEVVAVSGPELVEFDEFPLNPTAYFGGQHEWFAGPTEPSFVGRAELGEYPEHMSIDELGSVIALSDEILRIPIQRVLPGDANLDNRVDGADFLIWNRNKFFDDQDKSWQLGDFNGDELVDGEDFLIWNRNKFTVYVGPTDVTSVPEPSFQLAFAIALGIVLLRYKGH